MNKQLASLLSFSLILSALGPAPALAISAQRGAPVNAAAPIRVPGSFLGSGLGAHQGLPGINQLPTSLIPNGIAVGTQETLLREAVAPQSSPLAKSGSQLEVARPVAVTAAPSANPTEQNTAPQSVLGRLARVAAKAIGWDKVFDQAVSAPAVPLGGQMGIRPLPAPTLPGGVVLDQPPTAPDARVVPTISINAFSIPGAKTTGIFDSGPRVLQADPTNEAQVEKALRDLVDQETASFGIRSADLQTVHVKRVAGKNGQADTIYGYFWQQRAGVPVHGSHLSFSVKVLNGKPTVMGTTAKLYPNLAVQTTQTMSDDDLIAQAQQRLGIPPQAGTVLQLVDKKIIYTRGQWRTVKLFMVEGYPIMIAVDVASGDAFAWDPRQGLNEGSAQPEATMTGKLSGRGELNDKRPNGERDVTEQPMPHLNVSVAGKTATTDKDGRFSATGDGKLDFTATLSGKYAVVTDRARNPVKVSASLNPGQETTVVFNPTGQDELTVSQVNAYLAVNRVHDWVKERGIDDKRLDQQLPINVNINQECNAYYTPGRPSLNFFRSSVNCSDTAKPGVVAHEWGHFFDDMIGGIVNGGLSEGWGDILSMYILGSPIVGEGFLKKPRDGVTTWIRHGENDYQYAEHDEVHDQGQAWMGFAWKLRKALILSLGEAAGAAAAEALIIPTIYAKAADIPTAMAQVLLNAMGSDGTIKYEAEIRAAAKAHGVDLPKNPGIVNTLWNGLSSWGTGLGFTASDATQGPKWVAIKAGPRSREETRRRIQDAIDYRPGEYGDIKAEIVQKPGWFSTEFEVKLSGDPKAVAYISEQLKRLGR